MIDLSYHWRKSDPESEIEEACGELSLIDNPLYVSRNCEAVNCFSRASVQIEVKAGHFGSISLFLCKGCVSKFRDEK